MLTSRPLQSSICRACRLKLRANATTVLDTSNRSLSTSNGARLHKRMRLNPSPKHSQRTFSTAPARLQHPGNDQDRSNQKAEEQTGRHQEEPQDANGAEEATITPEEAARTAKQMFGDILPEGLLNDEEYLVYKRLYGEAIRIVPEAEYFAEKAAEERERNAAAQEAARHKLYVEDSSGDLKEVPYYADAPEVDRVIEEDEVLEDDNAEPEEDVEGLEEGMEELDLEDETGPSAEYIRAHPYTFLGRFATSPSTIQLPKEEFVNPIRDMLASANNKHLRQTAERLFGGVRFPHSTSTPRPRGGEIVQKPIPLEASMNRMAPMESDSFMAAIMPGAYASAMSVMIEVRKRLGSEWLESLLQKPGGPLILDASSGGASVVAWREVLKAEWARMKEDGTIADAAAQPPLGKASVISGSDTLRRRAARFLDDTTFLPRLPDTIMRGEEIGPQHRKVYDIIVAPHLLWGIEEDYMRKNAIQKLWSLLNPNGGVLIILEKGVPRGFEVVAGARDFILKKLVSSPGSTHVKASFDDMLDEGLIEKDKGMIVAPCTNHLGCPMYKIPGISRNRKDFCYFKQRFIRPGYLQNLIGAKDRNHEDVQFSYLAVMKGQDLRASEGFVVEDEATEAAFTGYGDRNRNPFEEEELAQAAAEEALLAQLEGKTEASEPASETAATTPTAASGTAEPEAAVVPTPASSTAPAAQSTALAPNVLTLTLPRAILPPLKRRGHVLLDVCTPAGNLERWTVPRSFGRQAYRDARKSRWGDLWALGAATRVQRSVRLGNKEPPLSLQALKRKAGTHQGRLSKDDKKKLKAIRGKTDKKGKISRAMVRTTKTDAELLEEVFGEA
ncbi:37S ribosomal protein-like protein Rsm22 [Phyllosticta citribraziliensis]|uniref:37S ribosomal protein-like protein Rsm22 n=1 Tax=Phyllosticta citribraziliensis TaxID=989973 RepID=A0ABR1LP98_9PEZI